MKKYIALVCAMVCMLVSSVSVLAGDVPESLLSSNNAQVFLGSVESYTTKEIPSEPYTFIDSVEVIPSQKIKGDVTIDVKQTYTNCYGATELASGVEYLFGYIDENNFYVYEIESIEGNQFKLVNADKDDMTKRLETYLNDGSFEKAENERLSQMEQSKQQDTAAPSEIPSATEADTTVTAAKSNSSTWVLVGIGAVAIAAIAWVVTKKKK